MNRKRLISKESRGVGRGSASPNIIGTHICWRTRKTNMGKLVSHIAIWPLPTGTARPSLTQDYVALTVSSDV